MRPIISISWKNSVRTHTVCCRQKWIWGQAEEGVSESRNSTAQLLCGCICFMKLCKDVRMGAPSQRFHTTAPALWETLGGPSCFPKAMHHSSWQGQGTRQPPAPWLGSSPGSPARAPSWHSPSPLPTSVGHKEAHSAFSSTSCAPCTSKDSTAESIRETRNVYISKGRKFTVLFSWRIGF